MLINIKKQELVPRDNSLFTPEIMKEKQSPFKQLRQYMQLSQAEFANKAGISQSLVSFYERGISSPTSKNLEQVLIAFPTVNPAFLLGDSSHMFKEEQRETDILNHSAGISEKMYKDLLSDVDTKDTDPEEAKLEEIIGHMHQRSKNRRNASEEIEVLKLENQLLKYKLSAKDAQILYLKTLLDVHMRQLKAEKKTVLEETRAV